MPFSEFGDTCDTVGLTTTSNEASQFSFKDASIDVPSTGMSLSTGIIVGSVIFQLILNVDINTLII
jgi:hypothetical protein